MAAKIKGTKLIWTVHDLKTHDSRFPNLEQKFKNWWFPYLDGVIYLTRSGQMLAEEQYPMLRKLKHFISAHGHFADVYPNVVSRNEARNRLGLTADNRVYVFTGQIRYYKNVPLLIEAFREVQDEGARLIIAGKVATIALKREIEMAAQGDTRILMKLEFTPDEELQIYLNAADLVVLPYREILNSGSAILALSFGRPILVPDKGALNELKTVFGVPWVNTFSGKVRAQVLTETMNIVLQEQREAKKFISNIRKQLDWHLIAHDTLAFFRDVISTPENTKKV